MKKCKVCKNEINVSGFYGSLAKRLISVGICHDCDNWMGCFIDRNKDDVARINGVHYRIGESQSENKGFGGRIIEINFHDGRKVITDNLWHQGEIPEPFKVVLHDNADWALVAK